MNSCKAVFKKKMPVVADRFHVRKPYHKGVVSLREHKDYFTESEKLVIEILFVLSSKLKLAYQLSRELSGLLDSHITADVAKEKMSQWIESVTHSQLSCCNYFIKTLSKYQTQIANYFIKRHNSDFVEGFNNKVKVLKRRCYGLSSATKLFQQLVLDTVGMLRFSPDVAYARLAIPRKGAKSRFYSLFAHILASKRESVPKLR